MVLLFSKTPNLSFVFHSNSLYAGSVLCTCTISGEYPFLSDFGKFFSSTISIALVLEINVFLPLDFRKKVMFIFKQGGIMECNSYSRDSGLVFGIAVIALLNIQQSSVDSDFFKKIIIKNINLIIVIGFLINIQTFPLYIELILLPLSTIFLLSKNKKLVDCVTNIFGFLLLFMHYIMHLQITKILKS